MKKYKQFVSEKVMYNKDDERANSALSALKNFSIGGFSIRATIHAASQALERAKNITKELWQSFFERVIAKIKETNLKTGEYIFYSRKIQQGTVAHYDQGNKEIRVITTLPKGASRATQAGTGKVMVEGVEKELEIVEID